MRPGAVENIVVASGPAPATREQLAYITQHVRGLVEAAATAAEEEAGEALAGARRAVEAHLDGLGVGQTRALALRWFMELHKGYPAIALAPAALQARQPSSR
jgi:hypothetical protein